MAHLWMGPNIKELRINIRERECGPGGCKPRVYTRVHTYTRLLNLNNKVPFVRYGAYVRTHTLNWRVTNTTKRSSPVNNVQIIFWHARVLVSLH